VWPKSSLQVINFFCSDIETGTLQTAILFQLYYDGNSLNQMNAENEDDFLHRLATTAKTNLTKQHATVTFESVHVRRLQIYAYMA